MIEEIKQEDLKFYEENSLLKKDYIEKEFEINPFAKFLVLKEENKVIGYIYYSDIYERAEINQFGIETFHRNCGKGQKLLKKLIEVVDKSITLEVRKDNISAIRVYEKLGFKRKAIRKNYYDGVDGILMERVK